MPDFKVNAHVEELHRYVPIDATFDRLYHEYVVDDSVSPLELETVVERSLLHAVGDGAGVVCLTGDAGHGKTRLCCNLLERLGLERDEAARAVMDHGNGGQPLLTLPDGTDLRIVKDLSELSLTQAAHLLNEACASADLFVICANEGRLRAALEEAGGVPRIDAALESSVAKGTVRVGDVAVLNLNFQSVSSGERSLVAQLLEAWVQDENHWKVCRECAAFPTCPIRENRRLLAESETAQSRRQRIVELLDIVERTGTVVTVRDLLIAVALGITGGIRCEEVHQRTQAAPGSGTWQYEHLFHQVLFDGAPSARLAERLPLMRSLRVLDPGRYSERRIDEQLEPQRPEVDRFLPPSATEEIGQQTSSRDARERSAAERELARFLRRRDYFTGEFPSAASRLGIRGYGAFMQVAGDSISDEELITARGGLLRGLEAVQGIRRQPPLVELVVLDPAFGGRKQPVGIEGGTIPIAMVSLDPLSSYWASLSSAPRISEAVDWLERTIRLELRSVDASAVVRLDLLAWEFLERAGKGLEASDFYAALVRRMLRELARLAESPDGDQSAVRVITADGRKQLVFDVGGRVTVAPA